MTKIKEIIHKIFLGLNQSEKQKRKQFILIKSNLYWSAFWNNQTDEEIKNTYTSFVDFLENLNPNEKKKYYFLLLKISNYLGYAYEVVNSPKKHAFRINEKLDTWFKQEHNTPPRKFLLQQLGEKSYLCAICAIVAFLSKDNTPEEKNELLILQKERLNVALQNSPDLKQEINYWYALHCFLKNEKENARFFLKKTIKNKKQIENISWLLDDSKNWLKNKLPSDFLSFVKNIYEQETIGYNVKEQTPILSKI